MNENCFRILMFLVVVLFINHILACLWIFAASLSDQNWINARLGADVEEQSKADLYLMSFYFVTTTVTTVGYGDINPSNGIERIFSIIMLFVGVMWFATISGSLTSIITQSDNQQAGLRSRLDTLSSLKTQYKLDPSLYIQLRDAVKFERSK